jgi:hypothetical protein
MRLDGITFDQDVNLKCPKFGGIEIQAYLTGLQAGIGAETFNKIVDDCIGVNWSPM